MLSDIYFWYYWITILDIEWSFSRLKQSRFASVGNAKPSLCNKVFAQGKTKLLRLKSKYSSSASMFGEPLRGSQVG